MAPPADVWLLALLRLPSLSTVSPETRLSLLAPHGEVYSALFAHKLHLV